MIDLFTLGYYATKTRFASYGDLLNEIPCSGLNNIVRHIPECPYNKCDDGYKDWKTENLPLVYFTRNNTRPKRQDNNVFASGFAVIDIDSKPNAEYISEHEAVWCTYKTGNGTHILIHTNKWGINQQQWQDTYNSIAYEIWCELCNKYKDHIRFDGRCSHYWYGCYLWRSELVYNKNFNINYAPEERYLSGTILEEMYDAESYNREDDAGSYTTPDKNLLKRTKKFNDNQKTIDGIAGNSKKREISQRMLDDFKVLSYKELLDKYEDTYSIVEGSELQFSDFTAYDGSVYNMCETKGEAVVLWNPLKRRIDNNKQSYVIEKGKRRKTLFYHLVQLCQLTTENLDPDYVLYDAVHWTYHYSFEGHSFPKNELIDTTISALVKFSEYDSTLYTDTRMFVSGKTMTDTDTGEITYMNTSEKISANNKCRKTVRIQMVVDKWNPNLSLEDNVEHIHNLDYESYRTISKLSKKTLLNYIKLAKQMPALVLKHSWLENIDFSNTKKQNGSKGGQKTKKITIKNILSGETTTFKSCKDCMKALNINNRKRFSKFIKGTSSLNKIYEIIQR